VSQFGGSRALDAVCRADGSAVLFVPVVIIIIITSTIQLYHKTHITTPLTPCLLLPQLLPPRRQGRADQRAPIPQDDLRGRQLHRRQRQRDGDASRQLAVQLGDDVHLDRSGHQVRHGRDHHVPNLRRQQCDGARDGVHLPGDQQRPAARHRHSRRHGHAGRAADAEGGRVGLPVHNVECERQPNGGDRVVRRQRQARRGQREVAGDAKRHPVVRPRRVREARREGLHGRGVEGADRQAGQLVVVEELVERHALEVHLDRLQNAGRAGGDLDVMRPRQAANGARRRDGQRLPRRALGARRGRPRGVEGEGRHRADRRRGRRGREVDLVVAAGRQADQLVLLEEGVGVVADGLRELRVEVGDEGLGERVLDGVLHEVQQPRDAAVEAQIKVADREVAHHRSEEEGAILLADVHNEGTSKARSGGIDVNVSADEGLLQVDVGRGTEGNAGDGQDVLGPLHNARHAVVASDTGNLDVLDFNVNTTGIEVLIGDRGRLKLGNNDGFHHPRPDLEQIIGNENTKAARIRGDRQEKG